MKTDLQYLEEAYNYACIYSQCIKTKVGAIIIDGRGVRLGANRVIGDNCRSYGCRRIQKYGSNSAKYRGAGDCLAIHSEIAAIASMPSIRRPDTSYPPSTIWITRCPCESCAKAIIASGIERVVYGGVEPISAITKTFFEHIEVLHIPEFVTPINNM